ncbi:PAS and ANTAR domain-containing protein [Tsukamurella sp. 8F]|uniref:PAS and ANTAR domain-containing protein n=1 Tax=unclassified Tsukamurella TaxID=2633480 RepID=UPI0023B976CB|nr:MULTISPECIES: PAS and ANTAR domain-containing protein [unclassified Tsukamurella]MDF0528819.1 PAS and ANTAR domain-containing protein [Tsukamurella sp. 8J]MDF0586654.1 PAS and ANTAR domain-containing protein [Tsukamurella sp. 8F]
MPFEAIPDDADAPIPTRRAQGKGAGRPRVGQFRFYFADDRWEWSDEVAVMHGYEPGTVTPTTELMLRHKHPDDYAAVAENLRNSIDTGSPFSSRHRIVDTRGDVHQMVVVADRMYDDGGVIGSEGVYVDITEAIDSEVRSSLRVVLPRYTASREAIDRAKGIVTFVYGVSADRAFDILRWRSQEANVKVRHIAEQLLADVEASRGMLMPRSAREAFDHILLTTHERVTPDRPSRS